MAKGNTSSSSQLPTRKRRKIHAETLPEYIALAEVAHLLDVSRRSVRRWLKQAGLHAFVAPGGATATVRYLRAEVLKWIEQQRERHPA